MNNPGIDLSIWKQLNQKWKKIDREGHLLEIEFKIILDENDKNKTLAIDVIQKIDDEVTTETIQHVAGEGYEPLGIACLSLECLVEVYKETLHQLHDRSNIPNSYLIVTMVPSSPSSGEVKGYLEKQKMKQLFSIPVNYQHYYLLNAIRDKMIELTGDAWSQAKVVYWKDTLEFFFEY